MAPMQKHLEFWVLCAVHEGRWAPLSVPLQGLGGALAVFGFREEALLYALLSGGEGDHRANALDAAELSALLSGPWSRFEWVALDPLPGTGLVNRSAGMDREDFLALLASRIRKARGAAALLGARR